MFLFSALNCSVVTRERIILPQGSMSSALGVPTNQLAAEEASYQRAMQRAQAKEADRQLKAAQAAAAIFKAKLKAASKREEYVMSALRRLAADLLCKMTSEPLSPSGVSLCLNISVCCRLEIGWQ
jgi:hypothetical protein